MRFARLPRDPRRPLRRVTSLAILLAIALPLAACQTSATTGGDDAVHPGLPEGVPNYMVKGKPDAKLTMFEWSDYECPYCGMFVSETEAKLIDEYLDKGLLRIVWRDIPLSSIHPHAQKAAEAARCAGELGGTKGYWGMHDRLFETQDDWSSKEDAVPDFKRFAGDLKLDQARFDACLDDGEQEQAVLDDLEAAAAAGVQATPSFTIGENFIEGALPYDMFAEKLDIILDGGSLPTATVEPTPEWVEVDAPRVDVEVGTAPVRGAEEAPVTFIEFSDYQCPYCAGFYTSSNDTLIEEFVDTGKVRYVWKDFPLMSIHPHAALAAQAGHCARDQGGDEAYWKMHDALFGAQDQWSGAAKSEEACRSAGETTDAAVKACVDGPVVAAFAKLAADAGLDAAALTACLEAGTHNETVTAGFDEALGIGLNGTPSFVINGQAISGVLEPEMLRDVLGKAERGESLKTWLIKQEAEATGTAEAGTK